MHVPLRSVVFYILPLLCELLEALLLWRLWRNRAIRRYPYVSGFVCYDFVRTPVLLVAHYLPTLFIWMYWTTDVPAQLLQFLIVWEAARSLFLPKSTVRRIAWNTLLVATGLGFPAILALCWGQASLVWFPGRSIASTFEQYSSLAQALLLLVIAAVARYYRVPFGRNMRGLIFSFGPYLLADSLSFITYQVFVGLRGYLEFLPAALFMTMMAAWLWAFWEFAPSPQTAISYSRQDIWKELWNHLWDATFATVKDRTR